MFVTGLGEIEASSVPIYNLLIGIGFVNLATSRSVPLVNKRGDDFVLWRNSKHIVVPHQFSC
jgi:hypothetical protein